MLGISLTEFIVILCVAFVFIKPEDMPAIMKTVKAVLKKVSLLKKEYSKTMTQLQKELDLEEEDQDQNDHKIIIDASGKPQIAYNIEEIKEELQSDLETKHTKCQVN